MLSDSSGFVLFLFVFSLQWPGAQGDGQQTAGLVQGPAWEWRPEQEDESIAVAGEKQ